MECLRLGGLSTTLGTGALSCQDSNCVIDSASSYFSSNSAGGNGGEMKERSVWDGTIRRNPAVQMLPNFFNTTHMALAVQISGDGLSKCRRWAENRSFARPRFVDHHM